MDWKDAGLREDTAFAELVRAVQQRQRVNAKIAIFDDHWQGYEAAIGQMEAAIQAYSLALADLRQARAQQENVSD